MTDKNQIKQYLQDRLQGLEDIKKDREWTTAELGDVACCKQTLAFIDSLQEEPVSNDLEEAAHSYVDTTIEWFDSEGNPCCYLAFKAGAKWQKEQMVKEVDLEKELNYDDYMTFFKEHPDYNNGDWGFEECWVFAEYFFELGLKAQKGG